MVVMVVVLGAIEQPILEKTQPIFNYFLSILITSSDHFPFLICEKDWSFFQCNFENHDVPAKEIDNSFFFSFF